MVTEAAVKGFPETVTPEQEAPPGEPESKAEAKVETEVDWKALAEKEKQDHASTRALMAKLEGDLKSRDGSRKREADIRDQLAAIHQKLDFQDNRWDVLETALAGVDDKPALEAIREKRKAALQQIEEKGKAEAGQTEFQTWWRLQDAQLITASCDKEGNQVVDLATSPALEEVRQAFRDAVAREDKPDVRDAKTRALIIISEAKREQAKVGTAAPKKAKESEEEMTDTGQGAGGAGAVSDDKIDAAWVKHDREHPGRANPYDEQYRRLLRR